MNNFQAFLLSIFIVACSLSFVNFSYGATSADLQQEIDRARQEREALVAEQRKLEAELQSINKEAQTLGSAVKSLDATKRKLAKDIAVTQAKIKSADLNLRSLQNDMAETESNIRTHREAIRESLRAIYEYDERPLVVDLIINDQISDVWRDRLRLSELSLDLRGEIRALREARIELDREKKETEKTKKEHLSLAKQLTGQKQVVEENKNTQAELLAETKSKEAEYQRLLKENLRRQEEAEADLFRFETELKVVLDPSLIPKASSLFSWPLDNIYITQRFGRTSASGRLYASGTHNGVDFRATVGTPVKAVLSGVVRGTGNTDERNAQYRRQGRAICLSYGRWVLIDHGNGLSTSYAHLSSTLVAPGQTVSTGDVIALSGGMPGVNGSGHSTGPHLHVSLYATQGVEIKKFVNSRGGCQETYMPVSDVKAYLDPLAYLPTL